MIRATISSDHAGYYLKHYLIPRLSSPAIHLEDLGSDDGISKVHYPDYILPVARKLQNSTIHYGILICNTGIGMSMAMNRYKQCRAALCLNTHMSKMSRKHNNANVLCLGASLISPKLALDIVNTFLSTEFEGERHAIRVQKFDNLGEIR